MSTEKWEAARAVTRWLWDRCDLPHVSLLAVLAWTSHAHWMLAGVLGAPDELRWLLPVAIDVYVLAALAQRRDLIWALSLDGLAVAGAHAVHLGQRTSWWVDHVDRAGGDYQWVIPALGAAWGVILVLVMWRVHVVAPTKKARKGQSPVKPQVRAEVSPPAEVAPVVTVSRPALVPPVPTMSLDEWVEAERRWPDAVRADVLRRGAELYKVSQKTVARRWDKLTKEAAA